MKYMTAIGLVLLFGLAASPARSEVVLPEGLRGLLPEYPGQNVLLAFSSATSDHAHLQIPEKSERLTEFYKRHFAGLGWKVEMEMEMEDTRMLSLTRDGRTIGFIISRAEDNLSSVNVSLERK